MMSGRRQDLNPGNTGGRWVLSPMCHPCCLDNTHSEGGDIVGNARYAQTCFPGSPPAPGSPRDPFSPGSPGAPAIPGTPGGPCWGNAVHG